MNVRKQILAALVATLAVPLAAAAVTPDSTYSYLPLSAQQSIANADDTRSAGDDSGTVNSYPLLSYSAAAKGDVVEKQETQTAAGYDPAKATTYALSSYGSRHDRG